MTDINPIERIKELCTERGWSYYQLAKSSDLPYSTLSTLLNSTNLPSLTTLEKICSGFGISFADFFDPGRDLRFMSDEQIECIIIITKWIFTFCNLIPQRICCPADPFYAQGHPKKTCQPVLSDFIEFIIPTFRIIINDLSTFFFF